MSRATRRFPLPALRYHHPATATATAIATATASSRLSSILSPNLPSNRYPRLRAISRHLSLSPSSRASMSDSAAPSTVTSSGITPASLSATLTNTLAAQHVEITDISGGCGQAFEAIIVSPQFEKKNSLARHRLVNASLKAEIAAIHAWTPRCFTPDEWAKKLATEGSAVEGT